MTVNESCGTVLVIEDDVTIRETVSEALQMEGYEVLTASDGEAALKVLKKFPNPCLVLLDMMMPIMDGWEFLDAIKRDRADQIATLPIVIVSAAGEKASRTAKDCHGFIKKPIDLELLLYTVKKFCG